MILRVRGGSYDLADPKESGTMTGLGLLRRPGSDDLADPKESGTMAG